LARNQNNVSEWSELSIVSVSQHNKIPTRRVGPVKNGHHHHLIEK